MTKLLLGSSFAVILPTIIAVGSFYGLTVAPLLLIAVITLVVILVMMGRLYGNVLHFMIFGMALGLIYQTTMMGMDVVGSDIHTELYYAQVNAKGIWDITYPDSSNSSIVIGWLIPALYRITGLSVVWVMKAIIPIFLACVPVVLFVSFNKLFGELKAFYATIFFMIIPIFSLEMAQIAKSMVAELFFATMLLFLVSDWKWYWKLIGISGSLVLQIVSHYTVGILGICFMLCVIGFRVVAYAFKWWQFKSTHIIVLVVALLIGIGTFYGYHSYAANGSAWRSVRDIAIQYLPVVPQTNGVTKTEIVKGSNPDIPIVEQPVEKIPTKNIANVKLDERPSLVKVGVGADFIETTWDGKLFRLIQYLTQFMILIGGVWMLWKYKLPNEYLGLVGGSIVLLLMCIIMPGISIIINMSRFYHLSLFFIAPLFVLGAEFITYLGELAWQNIQVESN